MRARAIVAALALLAAAAARADEPQPIVVKQLPASLAGTWLFRVGHDPAFASPFRERRNWGTIRVPGAWERQGWAGYNGHAWYRVSLFIASDLEGEDLGLDLGQVGDVDEVFLNSRKVGQTGDFPPHYDKATLARRFYLVPREALRFGQYNELAIHVFNDSHFGGLLGPAPVLDAYDAILAREVLRDVGAYCLATLLLTLAALQLLLFTSQRDSLEHLAFAGFLAALALLFVAYTHWGPAQLLGHSFAFRMNVAAMLLAIALFPSTPYRLARRSQPIPLLAVETLLALGAAFVFAWRDEGDLYLWMFLAQAATILLIVPTLQLEIRYLLHRRVWGRALLVATAFCCVMISFDTLSSIGLIPRERILVGDLVAPIGIVPLALVFSAALYFTWIERRWGEPFDPTTGLMPRDRFVDRLASEMQRARRTQASLTVALLRITVSESTGEHEPPTSQAVSNLRRGLRQIDLLARYDRETFVLLLAETEERAAMSILERLRRTVSESAAGSHTRIRTTAGVAQYRPGRHMAAEELLQEAEAALYAAVTEGGDGTATAP